MMRERREGNLSVSLTADAYDYNDQFFTLEVSETDGFESENDADVSGLEVNAPVAEVNVYLSAALERARSLVGSSSSVRRTAGRCAQAGMEAVARVRGIAPA